MLAHSEAQAIVRTAIRNAGGVTKWARRFGIQRGSIYEWIERAEVPSDRAVIIERESCGVAKRQDLRPNDYWDWWPDLPRPKERE
ncbi:MULTISPECIES: Cro/CI family transcriptional regulator [Achromobacter]|jgi:DNA-binding transcriptional regulator YdaS (Cro superfamily)|uniref:Cro/CI family transcriptional regulator n=2 Tax=Alcaligenaceae TaxID=506 RepID=A0A9X3R3G6_ALCXX|nr:Cro/CI family transcriptional regulator [Achromobacter xylosoxidans]MCZ8401342.1 Cro/CI family transcriptional regulator [Achromobacter xylosoxidans]MDH0519768.1 helix-turn-helix domain-containing protein [Achromobacter xylosoxidans]MDH0544603.1 helix-turn-helix domain-containing protein [Achromobacter xylosoxidans]CAB3906373.1 hypothetical protein LMG26684_04871 [Achromobacter mucicolens]